MNLLVFGGTGKLGEALRGDIARRRAWDKPAEGFFAVFCGRKDFDFGAGPAGSAPKEKDFMDFIKAVNPDCVINAAAVTDVALCESNPWKGFGVNAGKLDIIQRLLDSARLGATFCMSDESGLFCPTYAPSLAATILRMLARGIPPGIYHACGNPTDMEGYVKFIIRAASGRFDNLKIERMTPERNHRKPLNVVLDCAKLRSTEVLGPVMWQAGVLQYFHELTEEP